MILDFGRDGTSLVLLLAGGTKASQTKDIPPRSELRNYWRDYLEST